MIEINNSICDSYKVVFIAEKGMPGEKEAISLNPLVKSEYLKTAFITLDNSRAMLCIGVGSWETLDKVKTKELLAIASKTMAEHGIEEFSIDISSFITLFGIHAVSDIVEGLMLGTYNYSLKEDPTEQKISLQGIAEDYIKEAEELINKAQNLVKGIIFARDVVNTPGNLLRPLDFVVRLKGFLEEAGATIEVMDQVDIREQGLMALDTVGDSSGFKPYFVIIKYKGNEQSEESLALVGKGVTCDTGGYCLKPSSGMLGIKGDMAGGAAVAGAIYALAKNKIKTNVLGFIPICENRISSDSYLPGDVIGTYSGKIVEIINTDAEGRLILADAISYAIERYKVSKVVDIATLTGSVVNMFGFSVAGVLTNHEEFFACFKRAYNQAGERYWRLPVYEEYERMIESSIADIKNLGKSYSGTITAGLFLREFVKDKPWLHLDIAGTAWVDEPLFKYQSKGATGAGVSSLYYLSIENGECLNER